MKALCKIFFLIIISITCINNAYPDNLFRTDSIPSNKKAEIYLGGSLIELAHIGILFGDKTSVGVYAGFWPQHFSAGLNVKNHFRDRSNSNSYSSAFMRYAFGLRFCEGYYWPSGPIGNPSAWEDEWNPPYPDIIYLAATIGKNFYFEKNNGISLEGGVSVSPIGYGDLYFPLLPTISIKVFFNIESGRNKGD